MKNLLQIWNIHVFQISNMSKKGHNFKEDFMMSLQIPRVSFSEK